MPYTIDITGLTPEQVTEALREAFLKDLKECFEAVFIELATHCMDMAITHEVYAKYRGTYKRRRENGGLRDHSSYNIEVYRDGDSIIGYVKNVATGVGRAYRLDEAIVYGDQYDWELSRIYKMQPFPRDFYQGTIDRIEASNWVYHVRRKMNMRGWHTIGK